MILLKRIGIIFLHVVFMTVLIAVLGHYHIMQIPDENNLVQWDAGWYKNIVSNGYVFIENTQCNLAFFPLFPFAWKWLQISAFNMSIINCYRVFNTCRKFSFQFKTDVGVFCNAFIIFLCSSIF
jgi:hypothetical protein